jgi:hypothetical protein
MCTVAELLRTACPDVYRRGGRALIPFRRKFAHIPPMLPQHEQRRRLNAVDTDESVLVLTWLTDLCVKRYDEEIIERRAHPRLSVCLPSQAVLP